MTELAAHAAEDKKLVMIVDDEPDMLAMLRLTLEKKVRLPRRHRPLRPQGPGTAGRVLA